MSCRDCLHARKACGDPRAKEWVGCSKHSLKKLESGAVGYTGKLLATGWSYIHVRPHEKPGDIVDRHLVTPLMPLVLVDASCDNYEHSKSE